MSALGAPAVVAALHERLTTHAATSGLNWPEEGEGAVPYGRVSFVSGLRADTFTTPGAEALFQVDYWAVGETAALDAAEAVDAALRDGPLDVEGFDVLVPATATVLIDESDAGGHAFHAAVTPRLLISQPA